MNPLANHPDADLLLTVIEGEPLDRAARERAEHLLTADPSLARLLHLMRADRVALTGLAEAAAPANIVSRVEAELDREALAALAGAERGTVAPLAISRVEYTRPSIITRLNSRQWSAVAAAAGLALIAGVVFFSIRASFKPPAPGPSGAGHTGTPEVVTIDIPPAPLTVEDALARGLNPSPDAATPAPAPEVIASLPIGPRPEFGLPLDRALALAAEGRLVVRVRSLNDEARALQHVSKHGLRTPLTPATDPGLRLALGVQPTAPVAVPSPAIQPAPALASDGHSAPPRPPAPPAPPSPSTTEPAWRLLDATYAAPFAPTKAALRKLLADLRHGQFAVELIEVPAFAAIGGGGGGAATKPIEPDPDALLWWTRAATWNPPMTVPVVIEVR